MKEWVVAGLVLFASLVMLIGAIGVVRMPDLLTRMQSATKPVMLGTALLAFAAALAYFSIEVTVRAVLIAGFYLITAPAAAHAIARAAYLSGVPLSSHSVRDEWRSGERRENSG